jgi:hypothetical protein
MTDIHDPGHDAGHLRERGRDGGGRREYGGTCPLCGDGYDGRMDGHLPECDAA